MSRNEAGITVDGVWKKFRRGERHDSLRDLIPAMVQRFVRRRRDPATLETREFWALRDVNLEVKPGQALGIIGHNGAGKSTLLKLITRIMRPTLGRCEVRGRIGSLIELAAGFHPDLTGRENVFLQGAIMGMPSSVIQRRFDEIVAFSGVEEFIDTPVKRYSSGMNARLGFSIAIHLDPDVLIIDEVLSVGDLAFQERAFTRMQEVVRSGIPVAVVSHQLHRIAELATHAVLLDHGQIAQAGTPKDCIATYVAGVRSAPEAGAVPGLQLVGIAAEGGEATVRSGERLSIVVQGEFDSELAGRRLAVSARLRQLETGHLVFGAWSHRYGQVLQQSGRFEMRFDLQFNVAPGLYAVETWISDGSAEHRLADALWLHVQVTDGAPFRGTVQLNPRLDLRQGL